MRVKLDENVPRSVLAVLVAAGHDADTIVGEGLTGSVDSVVVQAAADAGRLLITLDRGLGDVRRYPPGSHTGILVLRVDEQSAAAVRRVMQALLDVHDLDSLTGTIAIVQRGWLRIRR